MKIYVAIAIVLVVVNLQAGWFTIINIGTCPTPAISAGGDATCSGSYFFMNAQWNGFGWVYTEQGVGGEMYVNFPSLQPNASFSFDYFGYTPIAPNAFHVANPLPFGVQAADAGDGRTGYIWLCSPPCTTNVTFTVQNNDSVYHQYGVGTFTQPSQANGFSCNYQLYGGQSGASSLPGANPGQMVTISVTVPCNQAQNYHLYQVVGPTTSQTGVNADGSPNNYFCADDAQQVNATPYDSTTNPFPGGDNTNAQYFATNNVMSGGTIYTNWLPVNSVFSPSNFNNIQWTATNGVSAVEQGSDAIYDAVTKFAAQNHADLGALAHASNSVSSGTSGGTNTLDTGLLSVIASNTTAMNYNLNAVFGAYTNAQGQQVAWEGVMSNDLLVITRAATNLGALTSNTVSLPTNISLSISNFATENTLTGISNLLASQLTATNMFGGISNFMGSLSLTNYALESTLEALTNGLFGGVANTNFAGNVPTNDFGGSIFSSVTNWEYGYDGATNTGQLDSLTAGTTQIIESEITTWLNGFTDPSSAMSDYYPAVDMTYSFDLGAGGSYTMDLDPLHNTGLAQIFAFARQLFSWALAFLFLEKIAKDAVQVVFIIQGAHGSNPSAVRATIKSMPS